jgi:fructose-specific phosphotransferase system IIA component
MLITKEMIRINQDLKNKDEVIQAVAELMNENNKLNDKDAYIQAVYDREAEISTNLGDGIAMPHARDCSIKEAGLSFIRLKEPIEWPGGQGDIRIVFGIAAPATGGDVHLKILASLARKLIYPDFKERLYNVNSEEELLSIIEEATGGIQ